MTLTGQEALPDSLDVIVIGAGPAGVLAALRAAEITAQQVFARHALEGKAPVEERAS